MFKNAPGKAGNRSGKSISASTDDVAVTGVGPGHDAASYGTKNLISLAKA